MDMKNLSLTLGHNIFSPDSAGDSSSGETINPLEAMRKLAKEQEVAASAFEMIARLLPGCEDRARVALSLCTTAHPLYTICTNIFGASIPQPTIRPNPR
jgi:hypothetical protein